MSSTSGCTVQIPTRDTELHELTAVEQDVQTPGKPGGAWKSVEPGQQGAWFESRESEKPAESGQSGASWESGGSERAGESGSEGACLVDQGSWYDPLDQEDGDGDGDYEDGNNNSFIEDMLSEEREALDTAWDAIPSGSTWSVDDNGQVVPFLRPTARNPDPALLTVMPASHDTLYPARIDGVRVVKILRSTYNQALIIEKAKEDNKKGDKKGDEKEEKEDDTKVEMNICTFHPQKLGGAICRAWINGKYCTIEATGGREEMTEEQAKECKDALEAGLSGESKKATGVEKKSTGLEKRPTGLEKSSRA